MKRLIFITVSSMALTGCGSINDRFGLSDDHVIEEFFEDKIDEKSGWSFDLSPRSPESR